MWLEQAEIDLEVLFLERFEIAIVSSLTTCFQCAVLCLFALPV
jgi:hypothetical protein